MHPIALIYDVLYEHISYFFQRFICHGDLPHPVCFGCDPQCFECWKHFESMWRGFCHFQNIQCSRDYEMSVTGDSYPLSNQLSWFSSFWLAKDWSVNLKLYFHVDHELFRRSNFYSTIDFNVYIQIYKHLNTRCEVSCLKMVHMLDIRRSLHNG